jgi:endonuclease III
MKETKMNKEQAMKVVIETMLSQDTTTTRGQLLLMDAFATTLTNETERAFRAGLKRGKALAAEIVVAEQAADVIANMEFNPVPDAEKYEAPENNDGGWDEPKH